jgi:hypothetical protein
VTSPVAAHSVPRKQASIGFVLFRIQAVAEYVVDDASFAVLLHVDNQLNLAAPI